MLTVDLSTGGEHGVDGEIGLFESNQTTFTRHKDAAMVTNGVALTQVICRQLFELLLFIGCVCTDAQAGCYLIPA
jgi:hypothetical protein